MSSKSKADVGAKETVLLRQARPKYSFTARKLPKDSPKNSGAQVSNGSKKLTPSGTESPSPKLGPTSVSSTQNIGATQTVPGSSLPPGMDSKKSKPVAVVGASLQSVPQIDRNDVKLNTVESQRNLQKADNLGQAVPGLLPFSQSGASSSSPDFSQLSHIPGIGDSTSGATQPTTGSHPTQLHASQTVALPLTSFFKDNYDVMLTNEQARFDADKLKSMEQERDKLKKDLDIQLQVNAELKRLLVASVGEDLSERVERLCRDRAQLSLDLGGYSKKMSEEYENLDKVSIQADMWRSKYLASRVMNEELGNARAYYALQCHDSQDALQQLLNERHELRTNLLETYKVLQQVKNAFDPLNSHRSSTLASTNVLDLSRSSQQLAEAIRFRLLPANVAVNIEVEMGDNLWQSCVTRAEQFAHEVLSRPTEPTGSLQSGSSRLLPLTGPPSSSVTRFHPHTRDENLTYNCCTHCKGEINVI